MSAAHYHLIPAAVLASIVDHCKTCNDDFTEIMDEATYVEWDYPKQVDRFWTYLRMRRMHRLQEY